MIGSSLLHYEIVDKLGEGGMGEVYRARDGRLGREVAIKVLGESFTADPERLARFEREAQLLASLNHPNIGGIHGFEEDGDRRFLVLELIEGDSLQALIERGLPLERVLEIAAGIAHALEAAHEQGIVHRDLKPANVKVTPDGQVKVLDFGLAKAWAPDAADQNLSASPTLTARMTQVGVILGTAAYMSPEQARGQEVDKRADIWSFGVLVWEMLTGRALFAGDTVTDTLAAVVRAEPDWAAVPARTPVRVREILARCLERDPSQRLRDIGEARIAFENAQPLEASAALASGGGSTRWARAGWVVAAVAAALATLAVTGVWPRRSPPPAAEVLRLRTELAPGLRLRSRLGSPFALSPDGRSVAFVAAGDAATAGLHVRDLGRLETRRLPGTANAEQPFFSPDGEWIGYFDTGRLRKISVRGGAAVTLAEGTDLPRGASWGMDGFVYFAPSTATGVHRVAETGGEVEEVTVPTEEPSERSHRWPQALPDGRVLITVLASTATFDEADLEVVDPTTGERRVVHRGGSSGRYLATGATVGHFAFVREGTLHAAPFDLDGPAALRPPIPVLDGLDYSRNHGGAKLSVAEDGTLLYVGGVDMLDAPLELTRVRADGSREQAVAQRRPYRNPRLSPDGRRVLFGAAEAGGQSDIWLLDLERGATSRLTFSEDPDFAPVWSADGRSFAFASSRTTPPSVWVRSVDGATEPRRLTENVFFQVPLSWSPDGGSLLVYQSTASSQADVLLVDVESGETTPYLTTNFSEGPAEFSPDGRWVAYASSETGREEVYVRPFPGGAGKWQISVSGGGHPAWSTDGTVVYFRGADRRFYAAQVTTDGSTLRAGPPRVLFDDPYGDFPGRNYDVAPDGSFLFLSIEDDATGSALPTLVLNWFDELRRLVPLSD